MTELSIIIPAYNEAVHLEEVISRIARTLDRSGIDYEIRIVNNGSRDRTKAIIEKLGRDFPRIIGIDLEKNQGYGGGIIAGLSGARGAVLGWTHADGQADPEDVIRLYKKMRSKSCELGMAVRVERRESRWRKIQGGLYFYIFKLLFLNPYRDINGTPKLMTERAARALALRSHDWFLEPEFVIKSRRLNMPICEIDTIWNTRRSGSTRSHLFTGLGMLKTMLIYRLGIK